MIAEVKEKVSFLEDTLNRYIINTDKNLYRMSKSIKELADIIQYYREQSDKDIKAYREQSDKDIKEFKADMSAFKDEMSAFKDEMKAFKDEMREYKEESQRDRKALHKKWGEITNKLGSFAEDIAAPNIPRIAKDYFNAKEVKRYLPNAYVKYDKANEYEFDAVVETEDKVFLLEVKFTPRFKHLETLPKTIENFKRCFPEYESKELITIFASMNLADNFIAKLTEMRIYAMAMGDETMDILNFEALQ